ncbi:MAG: polyphosphate kinase 1 [Candidatus Hydrogenedentota bacterium]
MEPKSRFIHREISWLSFNERVLEEAEDLNNPLFERLNFLAIFINNLDEFIMVRVAGIKRLIDANFTERDEYGYLPSEIFNEITKKIEILIKRLYNIYNNLLNNELKQNKISFKKYQELNPQEKKAVNQYFESTLFPVITPMAVDRGHPFPILPSKTISFALVIERYNKPYLSILPIPSVVPRVFKLPSQDNESNFILIDEIIRANLDAFFRGYKIVENSIFRILRDSELEIKEEYTEDLLKSIENELKKRPYAKAIYLELEKQVSTDLLAKLCDELEIPASEVKVIDNILDLSFFFDFISKYSIPEFRYRSFTSKEIKYSNIFDRIKQENFTLHLPFQSFQPVADFIKTASQDPNVLAIKMTLYRTNADSSIIKALEEAARNNKQVTVLVELRARFEEEKNILWAHELENAGCHVIYGVEKLKIHSKIALIVRKEEEGIKRYIHLSTGNYNEKTAKIYTDIGFFTANEDFARDISDVFNVISGYSTPPRWKKVTSAPNDLRQYFFNLIDNEIDNQKKYGNGLIFAKINSLADNQMIEKLYEASANGVKIKLIVRGICCLIPGVTGLSENIEVKSIVGRFLEHSRIYLFNNNNDPRLFLSSADWMTRNFDRRIELVFPVEDENLKEELIFILNKYWEDNLKSRFLKADKTYIPDNISDKQSNVQESLIEYYSWR